MSSTWNEPLLKKRSPTENHAERPEIRAALISVRGHNVRYSSTLEKMMVYSAFRLEQEEEAPASSASIAPVGETGSPALRRAIPGNDEKN